MRDRAKAKQAFLDFIQRAAGNIQVLLKKNWATCCIPAEAAVTNSGGSPEEHRQGNKE